MKYLKYFETEVEYNAYKNSDDFVTPNVSLIENMQTMAYTPNTPISKKYLICKYNVTEEGYMGLYDGNLPVSEMIVDEIRLNEPIYYYYFTPGIHTVKLAIKNDYHAIEYLAFLGQTSLISIEIPDFINYIADNVFNGCTSLQEIICWNTVSPNIGENGVFTDVSENGVLKVPAGSDYSTWMGMDSTNKPDKSYLGYYNWTIEYI